MNLIRIQDYYINTEQVLFCLASDRADTVQGKMVPQITIGGAGINLNIYYSDYSERDRDFAKLTG